MLHRTRRFVWLAISAGLLHASSACRPDMADTGCTDDATCAGGRCVSGACIGSDDARDPAQTTSAASDVPTAAPTATVDDEAVAAAANEAAPQTPAGPCGEGLVLIDAGTFAMGSPPNDPGRDGQDFQHQVTLTRDFCLGSTEVTQAQWRALMSNNPAVFQRCGDDCPVEGVNWFEALAYANARSAAEGLPRCYSLESCTHAPGEDMTCLSVSVNAPGDNPYLCEGYRLPTEAEWEYAARAGTTGPTWLGTLQTPMSCEPQPNLEPIAWYCGNANRRTKPVATRDPNPWGLYDMLGNVSEWCWDLFGPYADPAIDPLGAPTGDHRVQRGGSAVLAASRARVSFRLIGTPDARGRDDGFRIARTAP